MSKVFLTLEAKFSKKLPSSSSSSSAGRRRSGWVVERRVVLGPPFAAAAVAVGRLDDDDGAGVSVYRSFGGLVLVRWERPRTFPLAP